MASIRLALPSLAARGTAERARSMTLFATVLGSSLAFIDATVVIVALPTIEGDLGLGLTGQQWVFLSYSLALAALYLTAGAAGDRFGRRQVFTAGVVGFAIASALAGAAPNGPLLIAARALQGICGAFVTTNSLALLRDVYGKQAGLAVGRWSALTGVATIAGPPLGGALVEYVSWRWIFFLNLPLAAVAVYLAHLGRGEEQERARVGRLDVPGAALAATAFGTLTYGMVEGTERGFGGVWWAFVCSAVSLCAFAFWEARAAVPMLPFRLFRRRNFAVANAQTLLVYGALGGLFFFFTIYLQFIGFSPLEAGFATVPMSLVMILLASRFGRMADERGPRLLLTLGPALIAAGMLLLLPMTERADFFVFGMPGLALFSLGLSMLVAPITSAALSSVPMEHSGVASGVNQTVSRLGSVIAVALVGLVVLRVYRSSGGATGVPLVQDQVDSVLRAASIDAFRAGMALAAGLAVAGAVVGAFGYSDAEARRGREEAA
jgi:EmrB/QacA subfamily drug resistance transporter